MGTTYSLTVTPSEAKKLGVTISSTVDIEAHKTIHLEDPSVKRILTAYANYEPHLLRQQRPSLLNSSRITVDPADVSLSVLNAHKMYQTVEATTQLFVTRHFNWLEK